MKKFVIIMAMLFATACAKHAEDVSVTANDGKDGVAGVNGTNGQNGSQGPQGPAGTPGLQGPQGPAGGAGAQGPAGPAGKNGTNGVNGKDGLNGKDGVVGTNGKDGKDGKDGVVGTNGKDGKDGKNGASCTVVQLSGGLKVTCTDGTTATVTGSCTKGDKGDPGPQGPTGPAGRDGKDGKDGQCKECSDDFKPCGRDFDGEYRIRRDLYGKLYLVGLDGNVIQKLGTGTYHIRSRSCSKTCKIVVDCNDRIEDERGNACSR